MRENVDPLWLASSQCLSSHLEISNNSFEQGIPVFYNNGCIEASSFNNGACSTNGKTIRVGVFSEPCKEQTVTIGLASVTVVAHIKQYIKMLYKELIQNCQNGLFYFGVVGRTGTFSFLYNKLIGTTATERALFLKGNSVMYPISRLKDITTLRRKHYIIDILSINTVKRKNNHNETMVPFMPLRFHSSSMRFCAACLISSERLKRAKASSYVTFLISIIQMQLFSTLQRYE